MQIMTLLLQMKRQFPRTFAILFVCCRAKSQIYICLASKFLIFPPHTMMSC